ncbi:MAG: hypothetical protein LBL38_03410, partial [Lactobacillales bacterium]|nr:hypothetical protein [Lactobacillales bacterium]
DSESYLSLLKGATIRRKKCQEECDIYKFCEGGCNSCAASTSGIENNGGFDCRIFKDLFKYIVRIVDEKKIFDDFENIKNPILLKSLQEVKKRAVG